MAALFGGCGLGLFERVYCSARAIGTETETKGEKTQFHIRDEHERKVRSALFSLWLYCHQEGSKGHRHLYY